MNKDTLAGQWHRIKGRIKQRWNRLTDDDLGELEGHVEELVGLLQQRYGMLRAEAEREFRDFLDACSAEGFDDEDEAPSARPQPPPAASRDRPAGGASASGSICPAD
jgi:uncharacterized protein YjbJ (UPF0337 family)